MKKKNHNKREMPLGIIHLKGGDISQAKTDEFQKRITENMQRHMPLVLSSPSEASVEFIPFQSPKRSRFIKYAMPKVIVN